jgi:pimeloyl-ACP methyl ester carboxylesterase
MEPNLQIIDTGRVRLRVALAGDGPLVVLIHGFPEGWYSWRHQIPALAKAGYRVAAPDVRGYGGSDKPHAIDAYAIKDLAADIAGLIAALGADRAVVVGHDWGRRSPTARRCFTPSVFVASPGSVCRISAADRRPPSRAIARSTRTDSSISSISRSPAWPRPSWKPMCGEACASSTTRARAKDRRRMPGSKIRRDRGGSIATSTRIGCRPG